MMSHQQAAPAPIDVTVAYAGDAYGTGLAYALVHAAGRDRALRIPFVARVLPGLGGARSATPRCSRSRASFAPGACSQPRSGSAIPNSFATFANGATSRPS